MSATTDKDHFSIGSAAKLLRVHPKTLQRWDASGRLKAFRSDSNRRYYTREQLELFLKNVGRIKYDRD